MLKFLAKSALKRSEAEIAAFLDVFESGDNELNGMLLGMAALIHYGLDSVDPEFSKLLNSSVGENHGPILAFVVTLNRLLNDYHRAGDVHSGAGVKLWNITFRCMSNNSFRHYGQALWGKAPEYFESAEEYLESVMEKCEISGNPMAEKIKGALPLVDYVPPQFRATDVA